MDLNFGPEYKAFKKEVEAFCIKWKGVSFKNESKSALLDLAGPISEKSGKNISRSEWQTILIENGYFARSIPKEYGGYGAESDVIKNRIIASEFAHHGLPSPMGGQGIDMLVPTLLELGTKEQKQKYIKKTLHGEIIWCQGYSEPNAGSDLASLQTKAELIDGKWIINGQKIWTSTAQYSQMMFCLVRTEPEAKKHAGISYLLIPMDAPGIDVRPLVDMTLKAGFNEVFFTDVAVPEENIVGKRGEGWAVANATLSHERGSLTDPNATMNRVNALINRMKKETINGVKLIEIPIYRDKLMALQAKVTAFQSNSLRVLSAKLNPGQDAKIAGMIQKYYGTELRHELEGFAVDVMGELGTLYEDSPYLKDKGSWQFLYMYYLGLIIGGGTSQIQKNIISERGLGMPREPKFSESNMYFGLSEEQQFFKDNVNKFLQDHASLDAIKKIADSNNQKMKNAISSGILNLGINSLLVPEDYGGLGLDLLFATAVSQSLGENVAPFSFTGSYVMAPTALSLGGSEDQKNIYLNSIVNNEMKFAVGFAEYIAARNDFGFSFTKNTVSGKSLFVLDVENSSHLLIADESGQIGVIDINDKNIKLTELTTVDKTRTYHEIQFKKASIDILEETKTSNQAISRSIDAGRIVLAADSLGASEALLKKAVEYSKERKQFGRAIGSFQAVKHMCAEMASDLEPCYSLVWHAAHCFDNIPDESRLMACHAKSHVSEVSKVISKKATEVHGGMGFTDLMGIHYWFKRIGVNRQNLGSPETIREEAAKIQNL